ncbi:MAG: ethanolamine ammonia-lyase subunit EutC [Hyphomicrobium sp.]|nr:ethanolamine ammonia-lyase subunit EutC [Hyphomicrobium sp.]
MAEDLESPKASAGTQRATGVTIENPWAHLRRLTPARIALGRSGISIPTSEHLAFQLAHARARNAVHHALDFAGLETRLASAWGPVWRVASGAPDRATYLQRPDLGRRLAPKSAEQLRSIASGPYDVAVVICDGLSAFAIERNIAPFLTAFLPLVEKSGWTRAPLILAEQGRVALGDEIGEILKARLMVMLIGERPGLSSPDSLGVYLTYGPKVGLTDADRNCISNVRTEGLTYDEAAYKLHYLASEALRRELSGVNLKDDAEALPKSEAGPARNFLLDVPKG